MKYRRPTRVGTRRAGSRRVGLGRRTDWVMWSASAGVVGRPKLPDHGHLDLSRVLEVFLELTGDPAGKLPRLHIRYVARVDHDPDFPSRLESEDMIHAGKLHGQSLETLETLDIALERLPACTGPRRGDGVGRLDDDRQDGSRLHLVV